MIHSSHQTNEFENNDDVTYQDDGSRSLQQDHHIYSEPVIQQHQTCGDPVLQQQTFDEPWYELYAQMRQNGTQCTMEGLQKLAQLHNPKIIHLNTAHREGQHEVQPPPQPTKQFYKCNLCSKSYKRIKSLWNHYNVHTGYTHICGVCYTGFHDEHHLQQHFLVHDDIEFLVCEVCNERYLTLKSLKDHLTSHKNYKPYVCEICHHKFIQKTNLEQHSLVHEAKKCGRSFTQKSSLRLHSRTHSVERKGEQLIETVMKQSEGAKEQVNQTKMVSDKLRAMLQGRVKSVPEGKVEQQQQQNMDQQVIHFQMEPDTYEITFRENSGYSEQALMATEQQQVCLENPELFATFDKPLTQTLPQSWNTGPQALHSLMAIDQQAKALLGHQILTEIGNRTLGKRKKEKGIQNSQNAKDEIDRIKMSLYEIEASVKGGIPGVSEGRVELQKEIKNKQVIYSKMDSGCCETTFPEDSSSRKQTSMPTEQQQIHSENAQIFATFDQPLTYMFLQLSNIDPHGLNPLLTVDQQANDDLGHQALQEMGNLTPFEFGNVTFPINSQQPYSTVKQQSITDTEHSTMTSTVEDPTISSDMTKFS